MAKTLLVVDDSATMRKVFEMTFAGEDIAVVTHDGGDSLLARAREAHPAAIVVDVALARGASGYDVCRALKGDAALGRVPVLMLYSEQQPLDEARAREAGAEFSLLKPFDTQAAIDKVKQALGAPATAAPAATAPGPRPTVATGGAPAPQGPPGPPGPAPAPARSPASAGVGSFGAAPSPQSAPKSTQMFSSLPVAAPPGPAAPPAGRPGSPPKRDSGEVEIVMDEEDELPPAVVTRAPAPAAPAPQRAAPPAAQPFAAQPFAAPAAPAPRAAPPGPASSFVPSAPAPSPPASAAAAPAPMAALNAEVGQRVAAMGLTPAQVEAVTALTREVVERVVWEVVPQLAETLIREEIRRLTAE